MKKYAILTSVLALAACGGGSGGHDGGTPGAIAKPFASDQIAASNKKITNMVSNSEAQVVAYVVNKLGDDAESVGLNNVARTATSRGAFVPSAGAGDMNYDKAKELMELAQWLGRDDTSYDDITAMFNKSKSDQNKIKSALKLLNDMYCYVGGSADETARRILERRAAKDFDKPMAEIKDKSEIMTLNNVDLNTFAAGVLTIMKFRVDDNGKIIAIYYPEAQDIMDKHQGAEVATDDIVRKGNTNIFLERFDNDETIAELGHAIDIPEEYISYAKDLGLKYSDFGVIRVNFAATNEPLLQVWGIQDTPFAGGYATKNITNEVMTKLAAKEANGEISFVGLAQGTVSYHDWDAGLDGADIPLKGGLRDENATLTFNGKDGTQTLAASFSNWYDIEAVKAADGTNQFKIVGGTGGADSHFHVETSPGGLKDGQLTFRDGKNEVSDDMVFKTGYYGDNGIPSEAVVLMHYQKQSGGLHYVESEDRWDMKNHLNVELGFGGVKK